MRRLQSYQWMSFSAFLMFPLAVFVPLSYAVLFPLTAWGAFFLKYFEDKTFSPFPRRSLLLFILLHGWSGMTLLWSLTPFQSFKTGGILLSLTGSGIVLWKTAHSFSPEQKKNIFKNLLRGFYIGIGLLLFESLSQGMILNFFKSQDISMYKYNKATSMVCLFLISLVGILCIKHNHPIDGENKGKKAPFVILLGLSLSAVLSLESMTSKLALCAGGGSFLLALVWPRVLSLSAGAFFAFVLAIPFLSQTFFKPEVFTKIVPLDCRSSFVHRLYIWEYVGQEIGKKPLLGWGLDTSRSEKFSHAQRVISPQGEMEKALRAPSSRKILPEETAKEGGEGGLLDLLPLHPHNVALQGWLELGGIGAFLWALLISQIPLFLRKEKNACQRALGFSGFVMAVAISFSSYGAWQSWWISSLWLSFIYASLVLNLLCTPQIGDKERMV